MSLYFLISAADWKPREKGGRGQGHKTWCSLNCGEEGTDWRVAFISKEKGLGLIAMRAFVPGERIMVERLIQFEEAKVTNRESPSVRAAIELLIPKGGSLANKFALNSVGNADEQGGGLGLRISRANHACDGKASHHWISDFDVKALVANAAVAEGEEICINYTPATADPSAPRAIYEVGLVMLRNKWGIICPDNCVCRDEDHAKKMDRARGLDEAISRNLSAGKSKIAQRQAVALNAILQSLQVPVGRSIMSRVLWDAFQCAIAGGRVADARGFATRGLALQDLGPTSDAARWKDAAENPTQWWTYNTCKN